MNNSFWESKFYKDLMNGKLPEVEVKISHESLWQLFGGAVVAAVIILLVSKILKSV